MPSSGWEADSIPRAVAVAAGPVGDGADDLHQVRLGDAAREAEPAGSRRRRRLGGQHLDDRNAVCVQRGGLVPADQASTEDDGEIDIGDAVLGRLPLCLDREAGLFEKAAQIGLSCGKEQNLPAVPVRR